MLFFRNLIKYFNELRKLNGYIPSLRVIEIIKDEENFKVKVQMINSFKVYYDVPEKILESDEYINKFSPTDVRTLTYLGYLGINSPKYKLLAQRMIETGDVVFVIKQKGQKNMILKTAKELFKEKEFINNMSAVDASSVTYASVLKD